MTDAADPASFKYQLQQSQAVIRELLALLDSYTEVGGVMWCTTHSGVADETNTGDTCDTCDMSEDGGSCQLVALHYKARS